MYTKHHRIPTTYPQWLTINAVTTVSSDISEATSLTRLCRKNEHGTYPFPSLVVQSSGHVDGSRHVLNGESASYVTACDLVSNTGRCNKQKQDYRDSPSIVDSTDSRNPLLYR